MGGGCIKGIKVEGGGGLMKRGIACLDILSDKKFLSKQICPTPYVFYIIYQLLEKGGGGGVDCSMKG